MRLTYKKLHKWLMLLVGVQFIIWSISGLYMVSTDIHFIHGEELIVNSQSINPRSSYSETNKVNLSLNELLLRYPNPKSVKLQPLLGKPVYKITQSQNSKPTTLMIDAVSGKKLDKITKQQAEKIAHFQINGNLLIESSTLLTKRVQIPSELSPRHLPVWQVDFQRLDKPRLYISQITGEVVTKRHNFWRIFDWMWRLHIMDYDDGENINNILLTVFSILSLLAAFTGLMLSIRWVSKKLNNKLGVEKRYQHQNGIFRLAKNLHRYLSVLVFAQVLIWISTGLILNLIDHSLYTGNDQKATVHHSSDLSELLNQSSDHQSKQQLSSFYSLHRLSTEYKADHITLLNVLNRPYFLVERNNRFHSYNEIDGLLVDARTGKTKILASEEIRRIALNSYKGSAEIIAVDLQLKSTSDEAKERNPFWQVSFNDDLNTKVHIRALTGEIIGHINDKKRFKNLMLKLHFMDYSNLGSFNNWQNIIFSLGFLLLNLTGAYWLLRLIRDKNLFT